MKSLADLIREREPDLSKLERERTQPLPSEISLPRSYSRLVTEPIEEAMASLAARRHILELGRSKR